MAIKEPEIFTQLRTQFGFPSPPPFEIDRYGNAKEFKTIKEMLEFEIYWESKAIEAYSLHSWYAGVRGDNKTHLLFEHILNEEREHLRELTERLEEVF